MGGLLFVLALATWIGGTWWLVTRCKLRWAKVLVVMVSVIALLGDEVLGRIRLSEMCEKDARLSISEAALPGQGIRWDLGLEPATAKRLGYKFAEARRVDGTMEQRELLADGTIAKTSSAISVARYRYEIRNHAEVNHIGYTERALVDQSTGKSVATERGYWFAGGWVVRALSYDTGGSAHCGPLMSLHQFLAAVLDFKR